MAVKALHQIIAIEKGVKSRVYSEITEMHKAAQKPALFDGIAREYQPKDDQGESLPPENRRVQMIASKTIVRAATLMAEAFDVEAAKDWTNCRAVADVVLDGKVLVENAPATFLLYLEKQLSDLKAFIGSMPTLDEAEEWTADPNGPLFRSKELRTHRTRKVQRPIVLAPATEKHAAQTQLITEDVIDGFWRTIKISGALPVPRKETLIARIERMTDAVKMAREKANAVEVVEPSVGRPVFDVLFA